VTRLGWGASATAVVLLALGVGLAWPAILAAGAALSVVCIAAALSLLRPPDLRIERRIQPGRVHKGELAIAHLQLRNRAPRTFPGALASQRVGEEDLDVELPTLPRGERDVRTAVLPTGGRGLHRVGPIVLRRTDPFGLVEAETRYAGEDELLVLPAILPFRALRTALTRSIDGATDDTTPNGTMTFHQLREYVPGDDVRRIHWPSTAKVAHTGDLIVRQDVDDAQPYVVVLVDLRPQGYGPVSFELALDAAASAVLAVAHGRAPFQLRTTGGVALGGPSNQSTGPAIEALALAEATPDGSLSAELTAIERARGGAALIVVTGVPGDGELGAVAGLRRRFRRVFVVSVTPGPEPLQAVSGVQVVQGSTAEELTQAWHVATR
jgi:uncharacterized protein (DUF58 family)